MDDGRELIALAEELRKETPPEHRFIGQGEEFHFDREQGAT